MIISRQNKIFEQKQAFVTINRFVLKCPNCEEAIRYSDLCELWMNLEIKPVWRTTVFAAESERFNLNETPTTIKMLWTLKQQFRKHFKNITIPNILAGLWTFRNVNT